MRVLPAQVSRWRRSTSAKPQAAHSRRGTAALEFAILAPFFAIVLVGMFELSRIMMVKEILDEAARKGCRSGIIPGQGTSFPVTTNSTQSNIMNDVIEVLSDKYNNLDPTKATVTVTVGSSTTTTYSIGGSSGAYTFSQTGGSGADPLSAAPGTTISVKVSLPASSFIWGGNYFVPAATIASEGMTMAKQ